jgi:hypothetical protein
LNKKSESGQSGISGGSLSMPVEFSTTAIVLTGGCTTGEQLT